MLTREQKREFVVAAVDDIGRVFFEHCHVWVQDKADEQTAEEFIRVQLELFTNMAEALCNAWEETMDPDSAAAVVGAMRGALNHVFDRTDEYGMLEVNENGDVRSMDTPVDKQPNNVKKVH